MKKRKNSVSLPQHLELRPEAATASRQFIVGGGVGKRLGILNVTAMEQQPLAPKTSVVYTVSLDFMPDPGTQPPAEVQVSLYSIGIQGRRCSVTVLSVVGGGIQFAKPRQNQYTTWNGKPLRLKPARRSSNPDVPGQPCPPDDDGIWFLSFTGTACSLTVESARVLHRKQCGISHDVSPPPGDPGGQDGGN